MLHNVFVAALPGVPAHRPALPARRGRPVIALAIALAVAVAAAVAAGALAVARGDDDAGSPDVRAGTPPLHTSAGAAPEVLTRGPDTRLGIGGLRLDGDLGAATRALGPPQQTFDDMFGPAHVWAFPGGTILVGVWDETAQISALEANVDPDGAGSVAFHGGLRLGEATLGDVIEAWGEPARVADHPGDDFVAAYDACIGPAPVVVKFDHADAASGAGGSLALDEPVTRLLIAYADEPPGTGGCR